MNEGQTDSGNRAKTNCTVYSFICRSIRLAAVVLLFLQANRVFALKQTNRANSPGIVMIIMIMIVSHNRIQTDTCRRGCCRILGVFRSHTQEEEETRLYTIVLPMVALAERLAP